MTPKISYHFGNEELLDALQPLWEGLNRHHEAVSPHFKDAFHQFSFEYRKQKLLSKIQGGRLRVDLAQAGETKIGYCISSIDAVGVGEIESIYVEAAWRGQGIGDELMRQALSWLDENKVHTKKVSVAVGNESAYPFYARFGFYPRVTTLKQKVEG